MQATDPWMEDLPPHLSVRAHDSALPFTRISSEVKGGESSARSKSQCRPDLVHRNLAHRLDAAPLNETEATELARVLGALADPVRLRLLSLVASQVEICSCDLEAPIGKSQPTVSHHTKVLVDAGLLVGEKRGRWM